MELVVPGNFPIGCSAVYLTLFQSLNEMDYDQNGCLKAPNAFARYHNTMLKAELHKLRQIYPHANIIYADYYGAAMRFYHAPGHYGQLIATLNSTSLIKSLFFTHAEA